MRIRRLVFLLIFALPLTLMTTSAFFAKQTIDYRSANRKLILQNDSLNGAIIELNKKIEDGKGIKMEGNNRSKPRRRK